MNVLDPGHMYVLASLDQDDVANDVELFFVKRVGNEYPGNAPPAHPGTTTQEVLRVLIDRTRYVNHQFPCFENDVVISHLQGALLALEDRAAQRRGDVYVFRDRWSNERRNVDQIETCARCGHIYCREVHS